jgi:hypothetical protein
MDDVFKKRIMAEDSGDELLAFMFGIDEPLEREIMRFVYKNHNSCSRERLELQFVHKLLWCTHDRLMRRVDSLVKFNFLSKEEYKGTVIYTIVEEAKVEVDVENM